MIKLNTHDLFVNLLVRGMKQAHINYDVGICKPSEIPAALKKNVNKKSSGFVSGGNETLMICFKVASKSEEKPENLTSIVKLMKNTFAIDDDSTMTMSDVQLAGNGDENKETTRWYYVTKVQYEDKN